MQNCYGGESRSGGPWQRRGRSARRIIGASSLCGDVSPGQANYRSRLRSHNVRRSPHNSVRDHIKDDVFAGHLSAWSCTTPTEEVMASSLETAPPRSNPKRRAHWTYRYGRRLLPLRYQSVVLCKPSWSDTVGCHLVDARNRDVSACRCIICPDE